MKYSLSKNILIILLGGFLPEFVIYFYNATHHNDFRFTLQYIMGIFSFVCLSYLLILNSKGVTNSKGSERGGRIVFIVLSTLFLIYVGFGLFVQYALQNISIG